MQVPVSEPVISAVMPPAGYLLRLVPHFAQPAGNVFPGARQVGAGLRGGVESASVADHRLAERFGLRKNFLC